MTAWSNEEAWRPVAGEALDRIANGLGLRRRGWRWLPAWMRRLLESDERLRRRVLDTLRSYLRRA